MDPEEYVEIFREDFEKLDRDLWKADTGIGPLLNGWGNWEKQNYTESPKNSFVEDGVLNVKILKEDTLVPIPDQEPQPYHYTSARLHTKGSFSFTFGKVEARVRVTNHPVGPFSAVWLLSDENDSKEWPLCGEIDMFEYQAIWKKDGTPYTPSTLHFHDYNDVAKDEDKKGGAISFQNFPALEAGVWHDLEMEWTPEYISFAQDGKEVGKYFRPANPTQKSWPYHKDNKFHFIINNALAPSWAPDLEEGFEEHTMEIAHIVVKQKRKDMK